MWITGIFIAEMAGTFFLIFMTLLTILASKSSIINLKNNTQYFFNAIGIGISLTLGIIVAQGVAKQFKINNLPGYINPAAVLMDAIRLKSYDFVLPAIAGELIASIFASIIILIMFTVKRNKKSIAYIDAQKTLKMPDKKISIFKSCLGELLASFIFLGIIMVVILLEISPIFIGLAIILILLTFALRFNLILNPFATIIPMLFGLLIIKPQNCKAAIKNLSIGVIANLGVAIILGSLFYLI